MTIENRLIPIRILEKTLEVSCPADKINDLQSAAQHLDQNMREIKERGKLLGNEQIAIMAALNVCNELLAVKTAKDQQIDSLRTQINKLHKKIESTLADQEQLAL